MLYLFLVGLQPVFDQRRQVVGMSRLMQPSCQHLTEFVKLVNHRRDDEPQHASNNSDSRSHGDEDRQRTYSDVEFVFDKLHDRIEQVSEKPCNEEWQQYAAQIIGHVEHGQYDEGNTRPSYKFIKCNLLSHNCSFCYNFSLRIAFW